MELGTTLPPWTGQIVFACRLVRAVMMKADVMMPSPPDPSLTAMALRCVIRDATEAPSSLLDSLDTAQWSVGGWFNAPSSKVMGLVICGRTGGMV